MARGVGGVGQDDGVPLTSTSLSLAQARRIALRAQGLDRARAVRTAPATMRQFQQVVDRVGLLQIDSVNVLARAHLMPVFSRIGPYDTALLDRAAGDAPRRLVETWAHEASYVPPATYPLLGWRRRDYLSTAWGIIRDVPLQHSALVIEIRALVAAHGPLTASQVQAFYEAEHPRTRTGWGWNWTAAKRVLEFLFFTGEVTPARRNASFERCYDLTERVLPAEVLARTRPTDADAVRALVEISARAHGIGSLRCLADYFRISSARATPAVAELVEAGILVPVVVEGWGRTAYLHRDAAVPRRVDGGRCSARSTRSCSSAGGSKSCSGCATASRSTSRRTNGCTATTSCRSSWASVSQHSSTSRPTDGRAYCVCTRRTAFRPEPPARTRTSPRRSRSSCVCSRAGWGSARSRSGRRTAARSGTSLPRWSRRS
jgi:uncharacterized protein YcaQ